MLNNLPQIDLETISSDVDSTLDSGKVDFKSLQDASWWLKAFSKLYGEYYFAYKNIIYVPEAHVSLATSQDNQTRVIATSKVLPWVYAIRNDSVSSIFKFLHTMLNIEIRSYYFLFEFSMLKSHDIQDIPELIATGFLSSRKTFLGIRHNPEKVVKILKQLLREKIKI